MNQKEAAAKANRAIVQWAKDKDRIVIAIDGYTGIGKTTLLQNLCKTNPDILPINRDDFLVSRKQVERLLKKAKDGSQVFEREVCNVPKLERLIKAFRTGVSSHSLKAYEPVSGKITLRKVFDTSKQILVIEGVFMFHPKQINHLWDKRIYITGNIAAIDKRRVRREKKKWGKDYFPETHPDSYFRQVIIGLKRYQKMHKPKTCADLVLKVD